MTERALGPALDAADPDAAYAVPSPIPAPDRSQIDQLNTLYRLDVDHAGPSGFRGRLARKARAVLARLLFRQQQFNAAVVDHLNRNALVGLEAHQASGAMLAWMEQRMTSLQAAMAEVSASGDELRRQREALVAREKRSQLAVESLVASHEELRQAVGALQRATHSLKQEVHNLSAAGGPVQPPAPQTTLPGRTPGESVTGRADPADALDSYKYVGFEDAFRGEEAAIRERLSEYVPLFQGASDVLDVGCGRGEFLGLLRDNGITARGVDVNRAMVEACRAQGLDAAEGDALTYLRALPDGSLGGLIAAQVVEHLEPQYLNAFLEAAFAKLRPGAVIVLETINPACWFAFFESYIRDITHVRPLHPDTLRYLLIATGFQGVDVRYMAPYPEHDKLQPVAGGAGPLADLAETLNANVEKINRLLFTWLDYAAIGRRP